MAVDRLERRMASKQRMFSSCLRRGFEVRTTYDWYMFTTRTGTGTRDYYSTLLAGELSCTLAAVVSKVHCSNMYRRQVRPAIGSFSLEAKCNLASSLHDVHDLGIANGDMDMLGS